MDQDLARKLLFNGACLIFEDFPVGAEFGIDYDSWVTGEKFKGVKMIPPGIHFVNFSVRKGDQQMPRIGFFYSFKEKEVLVKKWSQIEEDLSTELGNDEEAERYRANLRQLDAFLAPYPYENFKTWYSLTDCMTADVIGRLQPLLRGRISAQSELVSKEAQDLGECSQRVDRRHPVRQRFFDRQGLPVMFVKPGTEIRFTPLLLGNIKDQPPSAEGAWDALFAQLCPENPTDLLGEMQFAFVCFLCGHLYDGFEQWKRLVRFLCSTKTSLAEHAHFFAKFVTCLYFQLKLTPRDFFVDIVSKSNFLTVTLSHFFANVESNVEPNCQLWQRTKKFKSYLQREYRWDFDSVNVEDEPVVVE